MRFLEQNSRNRQAQGEATDLWHGRPGALPLHHQLLLPRRGCVVIDFWRDESEQLWKHSGKFSRKILLERGMRGKGDMMFSQQKN